MLMKISNAGFDISLAIYFDHLAMSSRTLGILFGSPHSHCTRCRFVPTLCFRFLCSTLSASTIWAALSGVGPPPLFLVSLASSTGSLVVFVVDLLFFVRPAPGFSWGFEKVESGAAASVVSLFVFADW